jgi:hypothetical protein
MVDVFLCYFIQIGIPMEKTCTLVPLHMNVWITITVNFPHNIPICMCTVRHKVLEVHIGDTILNHDYVKILPGQVMGMGILKLHITTCYSQYFAMFVIVDMSRQRSPITEVLNMVKHNPKVFHVSTAQHAPNHIDSISSKVHGHVEHKYLIL